MSPSPGLPKGEAAQTHPVAVWILDIESRLGPVRDRDSRAGEAAGPRPEIPDRNGEQVSRTRAALPPERPFEHQDPGIKVEPGRLDPAVRLAASQFGQAEETGVEGKGALHIPHPQGQVMEAAGPHVSSLYRVSARR
jgi:hypothetical protein